MIAFFDEPPRSRAAKLFMVSLALFVGIMLLIEKVQEQLEKQKEIELRLETRESLSDLIKAAEAIDSAKTNAP